MNRIEMYNSSSDLRHGLHRLLATAVELTASPELGQCHGWWDVLGEECGAKAREHALSLAELGDVMQRPELTARLRGAASSLGVDWPSPDVLGGLFRRALISGKAHGSHRGRDVYGVSNKALWDATCGSFGAAICKRFGVALGEGRAERTDTLEPVSREALEELVGFDTSPDGEGHVRCVAWLSAQLEGLGFEVELRGSDLGRSLIVARRGAASMRGHVVMYGHYDVTATGRLERWDHDPHRLIHEGGRLYGRGVADNKGALASRLAALSRRERSPALTWLIQGEEEVSSPVAHALLPDVMANLRPTLWLEETGYHDHKDGTLRLLARTIGERDESCPTDRAMRTLLTGLRSLAGRWAIRTREEQRGLNKDVVAGGCPFNRNLPRGARYIALGVNDSRAKIHAYNESIPAWTAPLHEQELDVLFSWADFVSSAEGEAE